MRTILTREQEVMTLGGRVQLIYELLMSHFPREEGEGNFFGIRIQQYEKDGTSRVDRSEAPGLTENYEEAIRLFLLFVRETVMPVHLYELVDDWQSAFCSGVWELIGVSRRI